MIIIMIFNQSSFHPIYLLFSLSISGNDGSGKTTLIRYLQFNHVDGYTQSELSEFKVCIFHNIVTSVCVVLDAMEELNIDCVSHQAQLHVQPLRAVRLETGERMYMYM